MARGSSAGSGTPADEPATTGARGAGDPAARPAEPDAGSYEAARDALAEIVRALETGGLPLAESLAMWERGERLAAECERWLAGARARLDAATPPATG